MNKNIFMTMLCCLTSLAADAQVAYKIESARIQGVSERKTSSGQRSFIRFQNPQGTHFFIYDEETAHAPLRDVHNLKLTALAAGGECSIEIDCSAKAFCTGDCKNLYYEFTNAPATPATPAAAAPGAETRNRCTVQSFDCNKSVNNPVSALLGTR